MALSHKLKPGDRITIGDDITVTISSESYGTNIKVAIDAPRTTPINVQKAHKPHHIDGAC